jgi:uncharacterized membrane protein
MNKLFKELLLWFFIVLPLIYLWMIWKELPQVVPTHFGINGEPNDWSDKTMLIYLPAITGIGIYLLMFFIPRIDPKNKLNQMGDKYYMIRLVMSVFICAIFLYVLNLSKTGEVKGMNFITVITGAFFAILGNYFQTVRPNYFVGIRTPWTLENEEVWKTTHKLGGKIWMAGGLLIAILGLLIDDLSKQAIIIGVIVAVLVIVPIVYSYLEFNKLKTNS